MTKEDWEVQRYHAWQDIAGMRLPFDVALMLLNERVPRPRKFENDPRFRCPIEGNSFRNATMLHRHLRNHGPVGA